MSRAWSKPFIDALSGKTERLSKLAAEGQKILGYFCTYTPIEVIHASGFIPVRIQGGPGPIVKADSLTPVFICPYMRQALEKALAGEYKYLSGIVQAYTCDVACGLTQIWKESIPGEIFHTIPLPYHDGPDSRKYFHSAIEELNLKMQDIGGGFTEEALEASLVLYAEIRELVLELYRLRYMGKLPLSAGDFLSVVQAGFVTLPEDYLRMLKNLVVEVKDAEATHSSGIPLLVSGSLIEDPSILALVEQAGGSVVADDLCSGLRHFQPPAGDGQTAMERLIDRYIRRFPCPARSRVEERCSVILDLIKQSGARAVVFLFQKFCTPHLADHPVLSDVLKKEGIPSLALEIEELGVGEGQARTRLQAFFEMLEK
jgi:benzoyl-CoA reductase/2-hydroxyglutaryl-CoA dehydratase subunit BcrC/BadD/HgdB